jgi:hypothetical protein
LANIINGTDTGSGGLITTGDSSDELQLQTAEVARVTLTNTAVVVNESGANVDFRVEGDTEANLLFVDASADKVGIGTTSPSTVLNVKKDQSDTTAIKVENPNAGTGAVTTFQAAADVASLAVGVDSSTKIGTLWGLNRTSLASIISFSDSALGVGTFGATPLVFGTSNTERMRVTSDGYLRLAGGGIQFNGDTAAANALDDYEEGTFTPTAYGADTTGTTTYGDRSGRYTKIGRQVTAVVYLTVTNMTGTGVLIIDGLPFTSGDASYVGSIMTYNLDWPNAGSCVFYVGDSRTFAYIYISQDNGVWSQPNVDTSFTIFANITYFTS